MMTRRTFAGTLASAFAARAFAGKLNLGIGTYTYHSLSIDDMIVQLKRLEIREIEMSRGEFMLFSKPTPEKFQSVKTKLDAAGHPVRLLLHRHHQGRYRPRQRGPLCSLARLAQYHRRRHRRHPEAHR